MCSRKAEAPPQVHRAEAGIVHCAAARPPGYLQHFEPAERLRIALERS